MRPYLSLFNRLLDGEAATAPCTPRQYKEAVVSDLVNLLNTTCVEAEEWGLARRSRLVRESILGYGVPQQIDLCTEKGQEALARQLKQAIELYEPRLRGVTIQIGNPPNITSETRLYFAISATLTIHGSRSDYRESEFTTGIFMTLSPGRFSALEPTRG